MKHRFLILEIIFLTAGILAPPAFAASADEVIDNLFNFGNKPVQYDVPFSMTRGLKDPYSIDVCLKKKEFHFNETYNVWVNDMVRCRKNSKAVLAPSSESGVSTDPKDEEKCVGKRDGEIILQGTPKEERAREWSEHCSYLGAVGGAGPGGLSQIYGGFSQNLQYVPGDFQSQSGGTASGRYLGQPSGGGGGSNSGGSSGGAGASSSGGGKSGTVNFAPVYTGPGIQIPDQKLVAKGISKETSLIRLIVLYTNAMLPYVSVVSVLVFVGAGIFYILSFASEDLHSKAKTMMTYVIIGIIIIFSAYTIVNTLLRFATL